MRLTRLRLARFRSWPTLDIVFSGRPVAIHGPNGAGKTNLIEAISLFSPGRGLRGAASEEFARAPGDAGWKAAAEIEGVEGPHQIATWGAGTGRLVEIDGKPASQTALGGVLRVLWLTPAMDRLWTDAASERRRYLDRAALSLMPEHAEAAIAYDRALRERNRLLRDGARDPAWYAALEAQMAEHGARLVANRRAALARLASAEPAEGFPAAELALRREGPDDAEGLAAALRAGRPRDLAAGRSLTGPHRDDLGAVYAAKRIEARLCSTGEQKAMLISLALATARAVASVFGAAPILLLDEVAAHLDQDRRRALYEAIAALGAQAFMTGTGPELFAELGDRAQRLAVAEADGASRIAAD